MNFVGLRWKNGQASLLFWTCITALSSFSSRCLSSFLLLTDFGGVEAGLCPKIVAFGSRLLAITAVKASDISKDSVDVGPRSPHL